MAITYLGGKIHKRAGSTSTVSVSLTDIPAVGGGTVTLADGDLVVVGYAIGAITDINVAVTTGYTEQTDIYANGTQYDANLGVFTKLMGPTPDTTVTLGAMASANNSGVTSIRAYRGVDLTTPLDVAIQTATGTGTGLPDPPSSTPVTSGALAYVIGAQAAALMANLASSDLSDFATDWQADSQDVGIGVGHISWSGSGAIDPAVFTGGSSNASNSWVAATMVLRPAASSGDLVGTASLSLTPTGSMNGRGNIAGAGNVSFSPAANLIGRGAISGASALSLAPTGAVSGAGILSGSAALSLAPTGSVIGRGALAGSSAIVVTPSATMNGRGSIAGASSVSLTPTGVMAGRGLVAGSASLSLAPSGSVSGRGSLSGSGNVSITPSASLSGIGSVSGSASIIFTLSGSFNSFDSISGVATLAVSSTGSILGYGNISGAAGFSISASGSFPASNDVTGFASFALSLSGTLTSVTFGQIIPAPSPPSATATTPVILAGGPVVGVPVSPGVIVNVPVSPGQIT